jgi:tetratricopeptide (TPR) repeat protein
MSPQPETLSAPASASLECPACGTGNTPDSKFCRHCGQLLRAPASNAKIPAPPSTEDDGEDTLTSPQEIDARRARQLLDRALQLSERGDLSAAILACRQASTLDAHNPACFAMLGTLLERSGDVRGAVTAYERVVNMSPDNVLERESLARLRARLDRAPAFHFNSSELFDDNDTLPSLAPAQEEAASLEPVAVPDAEVSAVAEATDGEGALAIEARLPPTSASSHAYEPLAGREDGSLAFETEEVPSEADGVVGGLSAYAPNLSLSPSNPPLESETDPFWQTLAGGHPSESGSGKPAVSSLAQALDPETLAVVGNGASSSATSPKSGAPAIERRQSQRRQINLPVATNRRAQGRDRRAPVGASGLLFAPVPRAADSLRAVPASGVRPIDFQLPPASAPRLPLWAHLLREPSFFGRTLPLVAVGVLSLGFLSWARSQAVSQEAARIADAPAVVTAPETTVTQVIVPAPTPDVAVPAPIMPATNPSNPGVIVSNAPPTPAPVTAAPVPPASSGNSSAPRTTPRSPAPRTPATQTPRSAPAFPRVVPIPPAPVPPPAPPASSGGNIILPPPRVDIPPPAAPPIQVGNALSPGGSGHRDTINITRSEVIRPGVAAPPRSGSAARGDERDATAATRNGQTDRAINSLTNAIGATGSDSGYLYQQRAMAYMQRGDSARASEDFQSAINAYQAQIDRGENVAAAQAGLRAARSGLAVAQASR